MYQVERNKEFYVSIGLNKWTAKESQQLRDAVIDLLVTLGPGSFKVALAINKLHLIPAAVDAIQSMGLDAVLLEPVFVSKEKVASFHDLNIKALLVDEDPAFGQTVFKDVVNITGLPDSKPKVEKRHMVHSRSNPKIYLNVPYNGRWESISSLSSEKLAEGFSIMDDCFEIMGPGVLYISDNLGYYEKCLDILWTHQRGINVLIAPGSGDKDLNQYVPCAKKESLEFSLFYFGSDNHQSSKDKYDLILESAKFGDKNGFSAIWTPERHFNEFGGLFPNPAVLSAALAMITKNLQIRCGSIVSPLHDSIRIAEEWSVVDNLSNGRVGLSYASGWQCDDFVFFPERYNERHGHMLKQVKEVQDLWMGDKLKRINGLGNEIEVGIYPRPIQKKLPVWVTVSGKTSTFSDAGKIGANILTHLLWQDTDELVGKIKTYRKALKEAGFDPYSRKVVVMAHTFIGANKEKVKKLIELPLKSYIKSSVHLVEMMAKSNTENREQQEIVGRYGDLQGNIEEDLMDQLLEIAFQRFFENAGLLGDYKNCHHIIEKLKKYDVDEVACLIDFGVDKKNILESLKHLSILRQQYEKKQEGLKVTKIHLPASGYDSLFFDILNKRFCKGLEKVIISTSGNENKEMIKGDRNIRFNLSIDQKVNEPIVSVVDNTKSVEKLFVSTLDDEF